MAIYWQWYISGHKRWSGTVRRSSPYRYSKHTRKSTYLLLKREGKLIVSRPNDNQPSKPFHQTPMSTIIAAWNSKNCFAPITTWLQSAQHRHFICGTREETTISAILVSFYWFDLKRCCFFDIGKSVGHPHWPEEVNPDQNFQRPEALRPYDAHELHSQLIFQRSTYEPN